MPAAQKKARKQWVIEMAGLGEHRRWRTAVLSTGWRQRLALGCARSSTTRRSSSSTSPPPAWTPSAAASFWNLIYELAAKKVTVFVTTHYMDEAEYCDRLGLIYRGELVASGTPETLKTQFMQEDVLEVFCDEAEGLIAELEKLPGVKEAAMFGRGLHVVASDGRRAMEEIRGYLAGRGRRLERMEKIVPSLEDVFVSLIEARDRAEQPLGAVKQ